MIFIDELRIGNWVERIGCPLKVTGMKGSDIWLDSNGYEFEHYFYDGINPIELTEEWLIKFGLIVNGSNYFYDHVNYYGINETMAIDITSYLDEKIVRIGIISAKFDKNGVIDESMNSYEFKHIKYVHQLQNLYHALTGQEL